MIDVVDMGPWVETSEGRFYLHHPTFPIKAMAHSLSQVNRYNGHGKFPYSVATHSVLVSLLMQELRLGDPFEGFMHDGHEFVISDIASPWKASLPDYARLEQFLESQLRKEHGLPPVITEGCKTADVLARLIEAPQLLPSGGRDWPDHDHLRPLAYKMRLQGWRIPELTWQESKQAYLARYRELKPETLSTESR
jgi:hypothetical protein